MAEEEKEEVVKTKQRMSDQTLKHLGNAVLTVMLINAGILLLAGVLYYTSVDLTPAIPVYQAFAWWVLLPVMGVGAIVLGEKTNRKLEKRREEKKKWEEETRKHEEAYRKREEEKFMALSPDEKWRVLMQELRNK